jgi:hypothetical protein
MEEVKSKYSFIFFFKMILGIPIAFFAGVMGFGILQFDISFVTKIIFSILLILLALATLYSIISSFLNLNHLYVSSKGIVLEYLFLQKKDRMIKLSDVDNYAYYWHKGGATLELLKGDIKILSLDMGLYSNSWELKGALPWPQKEPKNGEYNSMLLDLSDSLEKMNSKES